MTSKAPVREDRERPAGSVGPANESRRTQAALAHDETVRVAVVTLWGADSDAVTGGFETAMPRMFDGFPGRKLLLLPGVHLPQPDTKHPWPLRPSDVTSVLERHGVAALFETYFDGVADIERRTYVAWEPGQPVDQWWVGGAQKFATAREGNRNKAVIEKLVQGCQPGGERTVAVGGLAVGLLVCGENNVLANRQKTGNTVYIRHGLPGRLFPPYVFT